MLEPTPVKFSGDSEIDFTSHLRERIESIKQGLKQLHETKLPEWRRMYEGRPLEAERNFPFQNASNLVVPLIGIHSDTLQARVVSALKTKPIFPVRLFGRYEDVEEADKLKESWEDYLQYNAIEPEELDLYRVESDAIGEMCRYGTSIVKVCNEQRFLDMFHPAGDGSGKFDFTRETEYDGPSPQKLALEDFGIQPSLNKYEHADIMYHRVRLQKYQLMERRYRGVYSAAKVDAILGQPDRTSVDYVTKQREEDSKIKTSERGYAEWDIYECWLKWRAPNQKYSPRIIAWYHLKSNTLLRAIYDFYPDVPFVLLRLLYRDDSIFGYGLCEMIGALQEEVSQIHNQRRDNMTIANTKVWRVDPQSKLHEGYEVYPSAMLPAAKDEIEPMDGGQVSPMTMDEERLALELAERRSGVSQPMQGAGAGSQGKRGVYTAAGTLSFLQEGNRRTDLTISDVRYAHLRLGRIISRQYAMLGLDENKLRLFGKQSELIQKAAQMVKDGKMGLAVSSSSASVNKEVEKQNDLLLAQVMSRHYQMIGTLIQSVMSSLAPAPLKDYLMKVIDSSDKLMKGILRNFDRDDADALVPKAKLNAGPQGVAGPPQQGGGVPGQNATGVAVFPQRNAVAGKPGVAPGQRPGGVAPIPGQVGGS